jgi:hypothetical protein
MNSEFECVCVERRGNELIKVTVRKFVRRNYGISLKLLISFVGVPTTIRSRHLPTYVRRLTA